MRFHAFHCVSLRPQGLCIIMRQTIKFFFGFVKGCCGLISDNVFINTIFSKVTNLLLRYCQSLLEKLILTSFHRILKEIKKLDLFL